MIRQAHTYLAGAISGTALIGAAVIAFVLLVSLQALRDWPLAGIGGNGGDAAVSPSRPAATDSAAPAVAGGTTDATVAGGGRSPADGAESPQQGGRSGLGEGPAPATTSPVGDTPVSAPIGGGGATGSPPSAASNPASQSGGGNGGGSGSSPGTSSGGGSGQSTSGTVTGTVNDTVSGADKALGGALGETGVTTVTEEAVNGVAGPESTVGKTVDKAVETVGGLLGGNR